MLVGIVLCRRKFKLLRITGLVWSVFLPRRRLLVANVEGVDYTETFAPVAKMVMVWAFLAVSTSKSWELHQMDVHNVFLHDDLDDEVYMKLSPGFEFPNPSMVCRLRKPLYGLQQAPRYWFAKLFFSLKTYSFLQSYSDYSLFTYTKGIVQINALVYVDELIVSGNDSAVIHAFKAIISVIVFILKILVLGNIFLHRSGS